MKGGTLFTLCKEDQAKIGLLYKQLLKEREEKEEILENYHYEKEKFEQIIDLLQHQKECDDKVIASSHALYPQKSKRTASNNMKHKTITDNSDSLIPIPFMISPRSGNKNTNNFQSPIETGHNNKSDLASPVEYIGKVFNDIKKMKGDLTKMQNNIQSLMFSPERSTERGENIPPNKINTKPISNKNKQKLFRDDCPELTLDDLDTSQRKRNRKISKRRKDLNVSSDSSRSGSEIFQTQSCNNQRKDNKNITTNYREESKHKSQRYTVNLRNKKENEINQYENLAYKNKCIIYSDESSESEKNQSSTNRRHNISVNRNLEKKRFKLKNRLFGLYKRAAENSIKISQKYKIEHNSRVREREYQECNNALYPSVTQIDNFENKLSQYNNRYEDDENVIINSQFINQTSSSIERSKDNRFNDSLYNIINRIEDNYRATTLDNDLLPTKIER